MEKSKTTCEVKTNSFWFDQEEISKQISGLDFGKCVRLTFFITSFLL